jgi:endonuclease YncB( thermonuclease family)
MSLYGPYKAIVADWHDGDTCHMNLDLGFGLVLALSCRVYGINAPELNTDAGKAALAYALQVCPPGTAVTVMSHGWDKYGGRFDGEITLPDARDFGLVMLTAGQAVKYAA